MMNPNYYSVLTTDLAKVIGECRIPTRVHVYGKRTPDNIRVESHSKIITTIPTISIYTQQPRNLLDKLLKRTRYELVSVSNRVLGKKAKEGVADDIEKFSIDLSHLDITYLSYTPLDELFD